MQRFATATFLVALAGCQSTIPPYKAPPTKLTADNYLRIQTGMTAEEVYVLLGKTYRHECHNAGEAGDVKLVSCVWPDPAGSHHVEIRVYFTGPWPTRFDAADLRKLYVYKKEQKGLF